MIKTKTKEEMIEDLLFDVWNWDKEILVPYVQEHLKAEYDKATHEQVLFEYGHVCAPDEVFFKSLEIENEKRV